MCELGVDAFPPSLSLSLALSARVCVCNTSSTPSLKSPTVPALGLLSTVALPTKTAWNCISLFLNTKIWIEKLMVEKIGLLKRKHIFLLFLTEGYQLSVLEENWWTLSSCRNFCTD